MAEFKVGDRVRLKGIGAVGTVAGEASVHGIGVQWDGEFDWCSPETLEVVDKPLPAAPCVHDWRSARYEGSLRFRCKKCGRPGRNEIVEVAEDDTDEHVPLKLAEEDRPPHLHRWSWDHGKDRWRCWDCGAYKPGQVVELQVFDVGGEG